MRSGDCSINPSTPGASGHNDLQRVFLSASARKRSGPERLATSKKVFRTARSVVPCRSSASGHRASSSEHTRGQSRETGSLRTFSGSVEASAKCISMGPAHCREREYKIQFGSRPPLFNWGFPTLVGPEQALVMEQEVATFLRKEANKVIRGLVCHDRSKRCMLPISNLPHQRKFLWFVLGPTRNNIRFFPSALHCHPALSQSVWIPRWLLWDSRASAYSTTLIFG